MIHPILSICNAHIALALLINLQEVDSVCSRSNTGVRVVQYTRTDTTRVIACSFLHDPFDSYGS